MSAQITVWQAEILDEADFHSIEELCRYATVSLDEIVLMVEEGILDPTGEAPEHWLFSLRDLNRTRIVSHLKHDLGVNLPGAAIIVELLEAR